MPDTRADAELWPHRQRLPLGDGFVGRCMAPGRDGVTPDEAALKEFCNIGYASGCAHLPADRKADVVRFAVVRDGGDTLSLDWVLERAHLPVEHGKLEYDAREARWHVLHGDRCVQRMAECFMETYLARHPRHGVAGAGE